MKAKTIFKSISVSLCAILCAFALVFAGCSYVNPNLNFYGMTQEQFDVFIETLDSDADRTQAAIGWATRSNVSIVSFFTEKVTEKTSGSSGSSGMIPGFGGGSSSSSASTTYYEDFAYDGSGVIVDIADDWSYAYVLTNAHMVCCVDDDVPSEIAYKVYIYMYGQDIPDVNYSLCLYEYETTEDDPKVHHQYGNTGCEWHWMDCEGDDNYRIEASVVACSGQYDLALLKVTDSGSLEIMKRNQAAAASFSESDEVYIGESVFAMGNPYGYGQTATTGVVSQDSITISGDVLEIGTYYEFRQIKTDAAVNSGNSGGGLYNSKGKIVGIVNSKRVTDGTENTGYALGGSYVKRLVGLMEAEEDKNISAHGIERAYLYYDEQLEQYSPSSYSYAYQSIDTGFSTTFSYGYYDASVNAARIWEAVACTTNEIKRLSEGDIVTHLKITDPDGEVVEDIDITRKYMLDDALLSIHSKEGYKVYLTVEGKNEPVEVSYIWVKQG